ncbi:MAG: class I SAM-dependent methyltransferase [Anaerolineales bacterium]
MMNSAIAAQLVAINRLFYADFGAPFSATRGRIQPGVHRVLSQLRGTECILDLGCGNGQLARALAERGHRGAYLGLDFSLPLLKEAERQPQGFTVKFQLADLTVPGWDSDLRPLTLRQAQDTAFDPIFAFAVLHHIPGMDLRRGILQKARNLLAPGGRFIHSEWQFLNSDKLKARIQPWERINLSAADVDPGDALLDWRSGGNGLRYAHHFSEQELLDLAAESGFRVVESFLSDGAGGRLGLYQTWEAS